MWVVALRPKPVAIENTPLAPTKAVPAAKQAAAASDAANAKLLAAAQAAEKGAASAASAPSASAPSAAAKAAAVVKRGETRVERVVLREISRGKVVVMLFWSANGADDVATRTAVRSLDRRNGKVKIHVIPIGRVGDGSSASASHESSARPSATRWPSADAARQDSRPRARGASAGGVVATPPSR